MLHGSEGEADSSYAVHGRGRSAYIALVKAVQKIFQELAARTLLEMSRNTMSRFKFALTSLGDHVCDDLDTVGLRCLLIHEDDLSCAVLALVPEEHISKVVNVAIKHLEIYTVFRSVHGECAYGKSGNCGDVSRLSTLRLDNEDSSPRR